MPISASQQKRRRRDRVPEAYDIVSESWYVKGPAERVPNPNPKVRIESKSVTDSQPVVLPVDRPVGLTAEELIKIQSELDVLKKRCTLMIRYADAID